MALQGRREEKVERPLPEGTGTCLFCIYSFDTFSCSESTCEAAEGSQAGGVRRCNGQCHQQVFKIVVLLFSYNNAFMYHLVQGTKTGKLGQAVPGTGGALQVCS